MRQRRQEYRRSATHRPVRPELGQCRTGGHLRAAEEGGKEGRLVLGPLEQAFGFLDFAKAAEGHGLGALHLQGPQRTGPPQLPHGGGGIRPEEVLPVHADERPAGEALCAVLEGQGETEANLKEVAGRVLPHHLHRTGGIRSAQVLEAQLQRVSGALAGATDGGWVPWVRALVHQHRIHHHPQLVLQALTLIGGEGVEGAGEEVHARRPLGQRRGRRVRRRRRQRDARVQGLRRLRIRKAEVREPRVAKPVGQLLELAGERPAGGLEQPAQPERIGGHEVQEKGPQGGLVRGLLGQEFHPVAAVGGVQRQPLHVEVRLLLQVVDGGVCPQQRLDELQVEPRHLRAKAVGIRAAGGSNPAQEGLVVQPVCFPRPQVDEGLELSGGGQLDNVRGVRQADGLDVQVERLRREALDELPSLGRRNERLEALLGLEPLQLPEQKLLRFLGVLPVA